MQPEVPTTPILRHSPRAPVAPPIEGLGADLLPPRYCLEGEVARGGMGLIVRVYDRVMGRTLALKALHEKHRKETDLIRRFLDEARIASQIQHPGVAAVHDLGELADGSPFFTMKLVEGRTLSDLLARRSSPAEKLDSWLQVFEQVAETVAYAHSKKIVATVCKEKCGHDSWTSTGQRFSTSSPRKPAVSWAS